ncbi:tetronasin resistance protein [Amphibacillus indicireducens]|uniref:ABC transporter permease n=1 Tax=Amphibacillus indicireducens TaxID=1076330 RepID=A0ABP7VAJ9_9BACI
MQEKFARWDTLFLQHLKRDWKKIMIWVLGVGLFSAGFVPAFEEIAKGQGLIGMFETMQNPAMVSIVGPTPIETATNYTIGAMYAHQMLLFCGLFAMIIAALHVVGHTRKEEDLGLTELVRSFQIGRQANSFATIIEVLLVNSLLALLIGGTLTSFGTDTISIQGSFLFGLSVAMAGLIGAAIALVMAQIMPNSAGATGSTLGIIGLLYITRAATDISNITFSMFNPLGWLYLTYPFTNNNWLPIFFALIFCIIMVMIAFALEGRRDMGAGYLPEREGRAYAKQSLLSVHGLFIKINKGVIISWLISFLILGAAYGAIYGDMQSFLESNDLLQQMFTQSGVSIEESFTATIMMVMMGLVAILPIVIINKLFSVEQRLYLSQLHATKVTRGQFYWTNISLAIVIGAIGILFAAGGLGITALTVMEDHTTMNLTDFLIAGYNFLPAVLFFTALAALALGWAPKLGKFIYVYLGYSFILNYFSGILDLPDWFLKTAIKSWIPQMPVESFKVIPFIVITTVSIILMTIGYLGYKKRDMMEGA